MTKVAVVIPNWNGKHWLGPCLDALRNQTFGPFKVIVVDNGSTDRSTAFMAERYPEVQVCAEPQNLGFAGGMNVGIRAAGDAVYVAALNNDTVADPGWLGNMVAALDADPRAGSVAALMLSLQDPRVIDTMGDGYGWTGLAFKLGSGGSVSGVPRDPFEVFGASAGACLYRKHMLDEVGLFDESYFAYMEDVDLALRARLAGWSCIAVPAARVLHAGAASSGGGPSDFSVRLTTRNLLLTVVKNVPAPLLPVMLVSALGGQAALVAASFLTRRPAWLIARRRAWARGLVAACKDVPGAIASRIQTKPLRRLGTLEFARLIAASRRQRSRFARDEA